MVILPGICLCKGGNSEDAVSEICRQRDYVNTMILSILSGRFGICRFDVSHEIPEKILSSGFFSVTRTFDELSVICYEELLPKDASCEKNWKCFKLQGPFEFTETGILSSLTSILAEAGIGILAFSTFDTDYIMVKKDDLEKAVKVFTTHGHTVNS